MSAQLVSLDDRMEYQMCFHAVTVCPFVLYVEQHEQKHSIASVHQVSERAERTRSAEASSLTLRTGVRQLRWFMIGMKLTCRDSNTSRHKNEQCSAKYLIEGYQVSDLTARTFPKLSLFPAQCCSS